MVRLKGEVKDSPPPNSVMWPPARAHKVLLNFAASQPPALIPLHQGIQTQPQRQGGKQFGMTVIS